MCDIAMGVIVQLANAIHAAIYSIPQELQEIVIHTHMYAHNCGAHMYTEVTIPVFVRRAG